MNKIEIINKMLEDMLIRRSPLLVKLLKKLREYFRDDDIKLDLTDYEKSEWDKFKRLVILKSKGLPYYDELKGRWFNEPSLDNHVKHLKEMPNEKKELGETHKFSENLLKSLRLENEILENYKSQGLYDEDYINLLFENNKRLLSGKKLKYDISEFIDKLDVEEYADFRSLTDKLKYAVISKQQEISRKQTQERELRKPAVYMTKVDSGDESDDESEEQNEGVEVKSKVVKEIPTKIKEEKKKVIKDKEMSGISGFNAKMKIFKDVLTHYIEQTYGSVQKIHNVRSKLMSFLNKGGITDELEKTSDPTRLIARFLESTPLLQNELDNYVQPLRLGAPKVAKAPKAPKAQRVEDELVKKSRKVSTRREETDETDEELLDKLCEKRVLKKTRKLMDKILSLEEDLRLARDSESSQKVIDRLSSVSTEVDDLVNSMESKRIRAIQQIQNFTRKSLAERQVRRMREDKDLKHAGILQSATELKHHALVRETKENRLLYLLKKVQTALKRDLRKKALKKKEGIELSPIQFDVDSQGYRKRLKKSRKKSKSNAKKVRDEDEY